MSATTLANCSPSPSSHSTVPDSTTGKMPGRMHENITTTERNASPMKIATSANSIVSPRLSFSIMLARVARGDRRQAGDGDLVAGMLLAHRVQRVIELLDDGKDLA